MYKKRIITSIFVLIGAFVLVFFVLKDRIAVNIQVRVAHDTHQTKSTDVIREGIKDMDKAILLSPENYLFYTTRANLLCKLGRYREAIQDIDKIFEFQKDYAQGFTYKGLIYDRIYKPDSALIFYDIAEKIYLDKLALETNKDEIAYYKTELLCLHILQNDSVAASQIELDSELDTFYLRNFQARRYMTKNEILLKMLGDDS